MNEKTEITNPYKKGETTISALLFVIFLLILVSLYIGFSGDLDKKHILSLVLSFLTLMIAVTILYKVDMNFIDIRENRNICQKTIRQ
jgi:hypothetical protein